MDNQLFGTEKDLHTALDKLAQASKERAGEFISIFYGEGVDPDQAEQALALFQTACPDAEITMLEGGQPVLPLPDLCGISFQTEGRYLADTGPFSKIF